MRIAVFIALFFAPLLYAAETNVIEPISTSATKHHVSSEKIWNLRNADIRAVISEIARITGKNFVIDPRVQGKISISSGKPMSNKALYQVFLSMLQVTGFAAVPSGDVIKIIPSMDAKTQAPDFFNHTRKPPHGEDIIIQVIPVEHVPAEQLVPVLRPLMPQFSNVSAYSPSNMLILSGQANNIRQIARIISQVDTSSANGIDIIPLHHSLAMDVVNTLKDLIKSPSTPGMGSTQTSIAADDRGNAILLSGTKPERIKYRLIISSLDKMSPTGDNSNTQVIYLKYLRAEDVVPILAGIAQANFTGTVGTTIGTVTRPALDSTNPAASMANNQGGAQAQSQSSPATSESNAKTGAANNQNEGSSKPTVQIIAEPNTNSVILNAPSTLIRILKRVISQLDIKPAQLLIEAIVAQVDKADVNNLGIEWGSADKTTGNFTAGFAIINSETSIQQFQAQIYALVTQHRANILSTPSVVVLDNRQAKILVGKQVSVASSSYPNNANGTAPSGSPYTTFDRVNVALHLYVRPQITHDRGIQLQIDQGNDTLDATNTINPGTTPTFNISAIVTSVHVDSGDIVVLGGLTQDSIGNDAVDLPILGKVPGLGKLFQHNIENREKKVLMVFIKTSILKNERDAIVATGTKYNDTRQVEIEMIKKHQYDVHNSDSLLKPLQSAQFPRPFSHPTTQAGAPLPKPFMAMK